MKQEIESLRMDYEIRVISHLERLGDMTTSDAQAFLEAHQDIFDNEWFKDTYSEDTAKILLNIY